MKKLLQSFWGILTEREPADRTPEPFRTLLTRMEPSEHGRELAGHLRQRLQETHAILRFTTPEDVTRREWALQDGKTVTRTWNEKSVGGPEPYESTLTLKHTLQDQPEGLFCAFIEEAHHCWQDWQRPFPHGATAESWLLRGFAAEADASAHVCRVAYELAQVGDRGAWDYLRDDSGIADIKRVFERELYRGMPAAIEAAHYQWERSAARTDLYRELFLGQWLEQETGIERKASLQAVDLTQEFNGRWTTRLQEMELPTVQERQNDREPIREHEADLDHGYDY